MVKGKPLSQSLAIIAYLDEVRTVVTHFSRYIFLQSRSKVFLNSRRHTFVFSFFKHAMTQFLVLCNWGRAGLDGHTSDTLEK
jgi:hypothetical protein